MKKIIVFLFSIVAGLGTAEATHLFRNNASNINTGILSPLRVDPATFTLLGPTIEGSEITNTIPISKLIAGSGESELSFFSPRLYHVSVGTLGVVGVDIATNIFSNAISEIKTRHGLTNQTMEPGDPVNAIFIGGPWTESGSSTIPARLHGFRVSNSSPCVQITSDTARINIYSQRFGEPGKEFVFDFQGKMITGEVIKARSHSRGALKIINSYGLTSQTADEAFPIRAPFSIYRSSSVEWDVKYSSVNDVSSALPGVMAGQLFVAESSAATVSYDFDENVRYEQTTVGSLVVSRDNRNIVFKNTNMSKMRSKAVYVGRNSERIQFLNMTATLDGPCATDIGCVNFANNGGSTHLSTVTLRGATFTQRQDSTVSGLIFGFTPSGNTGNVAKYFVASDLHYAGIQGGGTATMFDSDNQMTTLVIFGCTMSGGSAMFNVSANAADIAGNLNFHNGAHQ